MDLFVVNIVVNVIIGIAGFLIRQHLLNIRKDLDDIKKQVYATNGRLIAVEEWKKNHSYNTIADHNRYDAVIKDMYRKLDDHISNSFNHNSTQ